MIHWRFAQNDDGEESGINANYAAKFRGNRIPSLAREICQNSLDAALNGTVRVEFSLFELPKEKFPEEESYEEILHDEAEDPCPLKLEMETVEGETVLTGFSGTIEAIQGETKEDMLARGLRIVQKKFDEYIKKR